MLAARMGADNTRHMPGADQNDEEGQARGGVFATTHWSVVLAAGQIQPDNGKAALEQLCHTYWQPLYAYVRRQGFDEPDAQDLTQDFFARLLASGGLGGVGREKLELAIVRALGTTVPFGNEE